MPKRTGKQVKQTRGLADILDSATKSLESAAAEVMDGVAQRLEHELEKGARELSSRIAGENPLGHFDERPDDSFCQCEGNAYYGPDGLCQTCGLPGPEPSE